LKRVLDERYIGLLGLHSNATQIDSFVDLCYSNITGFSYSGRFSDGNSSYEIVATQFEAATGNQVVMTSTQNITGTKNSYISITENTTTIGDLVEKIDGMHLEISNSSGIYHLNMQSHNNSTLTDSYLLSGYAQIDQDLFEPIGTYSVTSTPQENIGAVTVIEYPNGSKLTATNGAVRSPSDLINLDSKSLAGVTDNLPTPPGWGYGSISIDPNVKDDYSLFGDFVYWSDGYDLLISGIILLLGIGVGCLNIAIGALIECVDLILWEGGAFQFQIEYGNDVLSYTVLYFLVESYDLFGFIYVPFYAELGYYANYLTIPNLNGGHPFEVPYTYYCCASTVGGLSTILDTALYGGHTDVWPVVPSPFLYSVTFVAYDELSLCSMGGVPFCIDGNWALKTSFVSGFPTIVSIPAGNHTIEVPDAGGAFDYFAVNDDIIYDNPVNITISWFTTIAAFYHHSIAGIVVGGSSAVYPIAESVASDFQVYYNSLGLGSTLDYIFVVGGDDADGFVGVEEGVYDVGMMSRLPTVEEWQSFPNAQLWAVGYTGALPPHGQTLNASKVLWMVTAGSPLVNEANLAGGVFISYVRKNADALLEGTGFLPLYLGDMAGGTVNDSTGNPYTPMPGQTQIFPDGIVDANDFFYFVDAYIHYYSSQTYTPYADLTGKNGAVHPNGKIDGNDFFAFVDAYIKYFINYHAPSPSKGQSPEDWQKDSGGEKTVASGVLSAVQSGTNSTAVWQVGPDPNPIGSNVMVDIRIDDAENVYGWSTSVSWNPSLMQLTGVTKGPYMGNTSVLWEGVSSYTWDNVHGDITGGLACYKTSGSAANGASGVLATLRFTVIGNAGNSSIALSSAQIYQDVCEGNPVQVSANSAVVTMVPQTPTGVISAVKSGTVSTSSWVVNSTEVNEPVVVDVRLDGALARTVWGWSVDVDWNASVLELVQVSEGSFLSDGGHGTGFVGGSPTLWDNEAGTIDGGLACADLDSQFPASSASSAVLATLTFRTVGYGVSDITLSNGNLRTWSSDQNGTVVPTLNATFQVVTLPASGVVSAVQSGTLDVWAFTVYSNETSVAVDLRIDNASCIWGWRLGVCWNTSVLRLADVWEGSFLADTDVTYFWGWDPEQWDNVAGTVNGGLGCCLLSNGVEVTFADSGVLATLTFDVVGLGASSITLPDVVLFAYDGDIGTFLSAINATITVNAPT
jgi:hypothetical protein